MHITETLTARIHNRMTETKNPCKHYKTDDGAVKATRKMAEIAGEHFDSNRPARFLTFKVDGLGWVGAIDLTELISRPETIGGYLGICTGFYTY